MGIRRQWGGPELPSIPFMGCSITHGVSDPQGKEPLWARHLGDLSLPQQSHQSPFSPIPHTGQWLVASGKHRVLRDAGCCGRQPQEARSMQTLNRVMERCIALRSLLVCCVPASLGCPPTIYGCTGTLMEALDIAPKGCRTPARAALAL